MKKCLLLMAALLLSGCLHQTPEKISRLHYRCGTLPLSVLLDNDREEVNLILDGNPLTLTLKQQPAASGTRYADENYVFWSKGDGAFVERNGKIIIDDCRLENR